MAAFYGPSFLFGCGNQVDLPDGWRLKESPADWALGIAPDGQEYYLCDGCAYPRRVVAHDSLHFKAGDTYVDMLDGVIELGNHHQHQQSDCASITLDTI